MAHTLKIVLLTLLGLLFVVVAAAVVLLLSTRTGTRGRSPRR